MHVSLLDEKTCSQDIISGSNQIKGGRHVRSAEQTTKPDSCQNMCRTKVLTSQCRRHARRPRGLSPVRSIIHVLAPRPSQRSLPQELSHGRQLYLSQAALSIPATTATHPKVWDALRGEYLVVMICLARRSTGHAHGRISVYVKEWWMLVFV